jgi:DNA polymerase
MIIGEAPGEQEDETGVPFCGAAGEKLNKILDYVGITRDEIFITNTVLCRPPNNRNPRQEEMSECKWRLDLQIQILRPRLVIALGRMAMQSLRGEAFKGALSQFFPNSPRVLEKHKDGWLRYTTGDHEALVMSSYHPSYLLRSPKAGYKAVLPHWMKVKQWVESIPDRYCLTKPDGNCISQDPR